MYGKTLEEVRAHRAHVDYMETVRRQAEAIRNEHDEVEEDKYWGAFLARSERYRKGEEATARPPEDCAVTTAIRVQAVDVPNNNDTLASRQQAVPHFRGNAPSAETPPPCRICRHENSSGSADDTSAHSEASAHTRHASRSICNILMVDSRGALWSLMSLLVK